VKLDQEKIKKHGKVQVKGEGIGLIRLMQIVKPM
jgi:hypothetical protein